QANGDMGWIRVLSFPEHERRIAIRVPRRGVDDRDWGGLEDQKAPSAQGRPVAPAPSYGGDELRAQKPQMEGDGSSIAPSPSAPGTGWGQQGYDPVQRTHFVPALVAADQLVLRYEYASGLRALGI